MLNLCRIEADDLLHTIATRERHARGHAPDVAVCGRQIVSYVERSTPLMDGEGCHVCLPLFAHPLAAVWATCRRWDADVNARACLEPAAFLTRDGIAC